MSIDVYKDRWLPKLSTFKVSNPPPLPMIFKVAMLRLENGDWNIALIGQLFGDDYANCILSLPVDSFNHADVLIWHFTKDGE